jgi:hypothetical protein
MKLMVGGEDAILKELNTCNKKGIIPYDYVLYVSLYCNSLLSS